MWKPGGLRISDCPPPRGLPAEPTVLRSTRAGLSGSTCFRMVALLEGGVCSELIQRPRSLTNFPLRATWALWAYPFRLTRKERFGLRPMGQSYLILLHRSSPTSNPLLQVQVVTELRETPMGTDGSANPAWTSSGSRTSKLRR